MSGAKSVSDYPEHLNPFHEDEKLRFWNFGRSRRNSISDTFKDLRNTLTLRSIRGKKKKLPSPEPSPVTLRKHQAQQIRSSERQYRKTVPTEAPLLLPRSKIAERATLSNFNPEKPQEIENVQGLSTSHISSNSPVRKDDAIENVVPPKTRRKKKRAPLPPGLGSSHLSLASSCNTSKWSLSSEDMNGSLHSNHSENEVTNITSDLSHIQNIRNLTKDIEKLTDQSNNNLESNNISLSTESTAAITENIQCNVENDEIKKEHSVIAEKLSISDFQTDFQTESSLTQSEDVKIAETSCSDESTTENTDCEKLAVWEKSTEDEPAVSDTNKPQERETDNAVDEYTEINTEITSQALSVAERVNVFESKITENQNNLKSSPKVNTESLSVSMESHKSQKSVKPEVEIPLVRMESLEDFKDEDLICDKKLSIEETEGSDQTNIKLLDDYNNNKFVHQSGCK